jgi:hypothetical protein
LKPLRGKRLTFLIASLALAVIVGAAFASRDLILTTWYAHRLRSRDIDEQQTAIASLGRLRTARAARILAAYLGDADSTIPRTAALALKNMGKVAMDPLSEAFQIADDIDGGPKRLLTGDFCVVQEMLFALLEIQRDETGVRPDLDNIGSSWLKKVGLGLFTQTSASRPDLDAPFDFLSRKYLGWKSGVQVIEGAPCRIFLYYTQAASFSDTQPQTILLTDVGGRVIAWKGVGREPIFSSCELKTIDGEVNLVVTHSEVGSNESPGRHTYRLSLRGIEEQR